jgi:hypothetical protein
MDMTVAGSSYSAVEADFGFGLPNSAKVYTRLPRLRVREEYFLLAFTGVSTRPAWSAEKVSLGDANL